MKPKNITINSFDDFVEESKRLPDLNRNLNFVLDPLESYFMGVADKHHIFDHMEDEEFYDEEY